MKAIPHLVLFLGLPHLAIAKPTDETKRVYMTINRSIDDSLVQTSGEVMLTRAEKLAIRQLMKLVKEQGNKPEAANLWYRLAEHYVRRSKAGQHFEVVKTADSEAFRIIPASLKNVTQVTELKSALKIYNKIESTFPKFAKMDDVIFFHAFALQQLKNEKLAEKKYDLIIEKYPLSHHHCDALLARGEIDFERKNHKVAIGYYESHLKKCSGEKAQIAQYKHAWSLYNLGQSEAAVDSMLTLIRGQKKLATPSFQLLTEAYRDIALFYSDTKTRSSQILVDLGSISTYQELELTYSRLGSILSRYAKWEKIVETLPAWQNKANNPKETLGSLEHLVLAYYHSNRKNEFLSSVESYSLHGADGKSSASADFLFKFLADNKQTLVKSESTLESVLKCYLRVETDQDKRLIAHKTLAQIDLKNKRHLSAFLNALIVYELSKNEQEKSEHAKIFIKSHLDWIESLDRYRKIEPLLSSSLHIDRVERDLGESKDFEILRYDTAVLASQAGAFSVAEESLRPAVFSRVSFEEKSKIEDLYFRSLSDQKKFEELSDSVAKFLAAAEGKLTAARVKELTQLKEFAAYSYVTSTKSTKPNLVKDFALSGEKSQYRLQALKDLIKDTSEDPEKFKDFTKASLFFLQNYGDSDESELVLQALAARHRDSREIPTLHETLKAIAPKRSFETVYFRNLLLTSYLVHDKQGFENSRVFFSRKPSAVEAEQKSILSTLQSFDPSPDLLLAQRHFNENKKPEAFSVAKKIIGGPSYSQEEKARARLLQGRILLDEFKGQGTKSRVERFELVLGQFIEKYEKAELALADTLKYSHSPSRIEALRLRIDLKSTYEEMVKQFPTPVGMSPEEFAPIKDQLLATTVSFGKLKERDRSDINSIQSSLTLKERNQMGLFDPSSVSIQNLFGRSIAGGR